MPAPVSNTPVARIVRTHGLKGEVAAVAADGLPFILAPGLEVFPVPPVRGVRSLRVSAVRETAKGHLVSFADIDRIEAAQALVGTTLLVPPGFAPEPDPEEDDSLRAELIGVTVVDERAGEIGAVVEIIVTGANDVLVVEGDLGEVLVPFVDEMILGWGDDERSILHVDLVDGLIPTAGE